MTATGDIDAWEGGWVNPRQVWPDESQLHNKSPDKVEINLVCTLMAELTECLHNVYRIKKRMVCILYVEV